MAGDHRHRESGPRLAVAAMVIPPVFTFMQRFLQHVLPQGFVKVRYCGFLAPGNRQRLALARELLAANHKAQQALVGPPPPTDPDAEAPRRISCPRCGEPLRLTATLRPRSRCPP